MVHELMYHLRITSCTIFSNCALDYFILFYSYCNKIETKNAQILRKVKSVVYWVRTLHRYKDTNIIVKHVQVYKVCNACDVLHIAL